MALNGDKLAGNWMWSKKSFISIQFRTDSASWNHKKKIMFLNYNTKVWPAAEGNAYKSVQNTVKFINEFECRVVCMGFRDARSQKEFKDWMGLSATEIPSHLSHQKHLKGMKKCVKLWMHFLHPFCFPLRTTTSKRTKTIPFKTKHLNLSIARHTHRTQIRSHSISYRTITMR